MTTFAKYFFGTLVVFPLIMVALVIVSTSGLTSILERVVSVTGVSVGVLILVAIPTYILAGIGIAFVAPIFGFGHMTRRQTRMGSVSTFEPTRTGYIAGTIVGLVVIPAIYLALIAIA